MGFLERLVCHLLGLPAFCIESHFWPPHLVSWFTGLSCGEQSEVALTNRGRKGGEQRGREEKEKEEEEEEGGGEMGGRERRRRKEGRRDRRGSRG